MKELLTLPPCHPFDADPPEREHGAVVVNMEEGHLVEFLPQDEKHRVQILDALGDKVPPQSSSHLRERDKWREGGDNQRKRSCACVCVCNRVMKGETEHLSRYSRSS